MVKIRHRLRRFDASDSRCVSALVTSEYELSSYQDAERSLYSESCWHNFDLDVRAICDRVSRFLVAVNGSLEPRSGGATDFNACERHKTTKATHARGEQS